MTAQQIVILSYQKEYRIQHRCDPHPTAKNDSDLQMKTVTSEEEAVSFIVKRLCGDPQARYLHILFTSWEGLVQFSKDFPGYAQPGRAEDEWKDTWAQHQSIWVATPEVDYGSEWCEEMEAAEAEGSAMCERIIKQVDQKLKDAGAPTAVLKKKDIK